MPVSSTATVIVEPASGWMSHAASRPMSGRFHCPDVFELGPYSGSFGTNSGRTRYAGCAYSTSGRAANARAAASASSLGSMLRTSKFAYEGLAVIAAVRDDAAIADTRALDDASSLNLTITRPGTYRAPDELTRSARNAAWKAARRIAWGDR